jgi:hypothetical protein
LTEDHWISFEQLLRGSDDACRLYAKYMEMSTMLPSVLEPAGEFLLPDDFPPERRESAIPFAPAFFSTVLHHPVGYFSGWPVAYLIATVILGVGLVIGTITHVSRPGQVAYIAAPAVDAPKTSLQPSTGGVGRITGMVECQWVDLHAQAFDGAHVTLGRKYDLVSGLVEITYDTGAKVILQGPVTYQVESANGGFLSLGKLTGEVKARQAKGFAVRTPTATVTDLGTEFGVEVDNRGNTTSHVFRGSVEVQTLAANGKTQGDVQLLHASQSARVERTDKPLPGSSRTTAFVAPPKHVDFVRDIPRRTIKTLDLVDVVAGGSGFSGRRDRGIDPIGEQVSHPDEHWAIYGTYCYSRVSNMPFIDGIFIPDGRKGPVQTDSAGHVFAEFPKTDNCTIATPIWAGSGIPAKKGNNEDIKWPHVLQLAGVDYSQLGHGIVLMIPNQGITFDLDAIRRANPEWNVARFLAVIANIDWMSANSHFVDFWVIVDGQRRGHFRQITMLNKAIPVNVPIGPKDRFLTIAATDGGDELAGDFAVFGDPRLELRSNEVRSDVPKRAGN